VRLTRADVGPSAVGTEVVSSPLPTRPSRPDPVEQPEVRPVKDRSTPGERLLSGIRGGSSVEDDTSVAPADFVLDPNQLAAMLLAGTRLWNPLLDRS
jgi:hypothetical protein